MEKALITVTDIFFRFPVYRSLIPGVVYKLNGLRFRVLSLEGPVFQPEEYHGRTIRKRYYRVRVRSL